MDVMAKAQAALSAALSGAEDDEVYIATAKKGGDYSTLGFSCSQCNARTNGNHPGLIVHKDGCPYK